MFSKNNNILKKPFVIFLLASFCCLLWGSAFPMIKTGYSLLNIPSDEPFSQILFAGIRFTLAGFFTLVIGSALSRRILIPKKSSLKNIFKLSLNQTVLQYFFFYVGLANTTSVKSSIIKGTGTFITILISCFIFKSEKFDNAKLIGCVLGFSGILVINLTGNDIGAGISFLGEGFILISNVTSALSTCLIKKYSQNENPVVLSGCQFFLGGIIMTIIGLTMGGKIHSFSIEGASVIIYLAMLSAVAYSLWGILLKVNDVSKVAIYNFMTPLCGVLLSGLLPGEQEALFNVKNLVALALVCAGILTVNKLSGAKEKSP
ncbi:MAG: DMT family transporter [Clostridiales bacterium]|nr:DMT family transporter [Clostridiales bacterium]